MLDYDNSAFYYFSITILMFYLIPSTFYIAIRVLKAFFGAVTSSRKVKEIARTDLEKEKATKLVSANTGIRAINTLGFLVFVLVTVALWFVCIKLVLAVWNDAEIAVFDPYAILGVDVGSDDKVVKKAYRGLSLKYHPDKNPGNKFAEEMFMKIAKAYEALTDETAKENWEKYGNPDGKQALEVSIGLPTFLLEEGNHNMILIVYLLVLVVIIPVIVGLWYAQSKQFGEKNVMYDTYAFFNHMLSENCHLKMLPETLAGASEFHKLNAPVSEEQQAFAKLHNTLKKLKAGGGGGAEVVSMLKPKYEQIPFIYRANCLLHAYLFRLPLDHPKFQHDLDVMLSRSPEMVEAMIELAASHQWLGTALRIIEFSQLLTQGLWIRDSPFLQLPHFSNQEVKHCLSGKGSVRNFPQYLDQPNDEKKGLLKFSEQQKADVYSALAIIPNIETEIKVFVEDEEQIAEGDLVSLQITITRKNIPEGSKAPSVHAPKFPLTKQENWWAVLGDRAGERILGLEKISGRGRVIQSQIKFLASRAGQYTFELHLKSDCYLGLDQNHLVKFTVIPSSDLPEYVPHPDDVDLDNEPTLFEQVMAGNVEEDSDSEDDEAPPPLESNPATATKEGDKDGASQRETKKDQ